MLEILKLPLKMCFPVVNVLWKLTRALYAAVFQQHICSFTVP